MVSTTSTWYKYKVRISMLIKKDCHPFQINKDATGRDAQLGRVENTNCYGDSVVHGLSRAEFSVNCV